MKRLKLLDHGAGRESCRGKRDAPLLSYQTPGRHLRVTSDAQATLWKRS
jgi:hypothetical protein